MQKVAIVFVVCLGALQSWASADVINTSFESPEYSTGTIVGQNGWLASSSNNGGVAVVDDSNAHTGSQALMVDTSTLGGPSWWYKPFNVDAAGSSVEIEFDLFLESNVGDNYSIFGVDIYNTSSSFSIFRLWTEFDNLDNVTYINTSDGILFEPVSRNAWHNYRIVLDYAIDEYALYFDGNFLDSGFLDVGLVGTTVNDVDIWATTPSGFGDRACYDNLRVTAVPESSTLACLTSVLLGFVVFNRRRHHV
ncbi:MAG: PEP-CTERM sorting domain-containing protein [Pirellulaceae bacterium]